MPAGLTIIATLEPVEFGGRTYVDLRTLRPGLPVGAIPPGEPSSATQTPEQRQMAASATAMFRRLLLAPTREILCNEPARPAETREGTDDTFDLDVDEITGDIFPVTMVTFDGIRCVDRFTLFGIELKEVAGTTIRIDCRVMPGFPELLHLREGRDSLHRPWAEATVDLFEFVSDAEFALVDGSILDVVSVSNAIHYAMSNETHRDARVRLVAEEIASRFTPTHGTHEQGKTRYREGDRTDWDLFTIRAKRKQL